MPITASHIKQSYAVRPSLLICPAHAAMCPSCCLMKFTCVMCQCKSLSRCKRPGKQSATGPPTVAARVQIQPCCKSSPISRCQEIRQKKTASNLSMQSYFPFHLYLLHNLSLLSPYPCSSLYRWNSYIAFITVFFPDSHLLISCLHGTSWGSWRTASFGEMVGWGSPSKKESAINLPLCHSFIYPPLLSFIISSSMSTLYLRLPVFLLLPSFIPSSVKAGHVWWLSFLLHAIKLDQYNPPLGPLLITLLSR